MTKSQLIQEVIAELTASDSLPLYITEQEIERNIEREKRWFYINYNKATEPYFYYINQSFFATPEFKEQRSIILPDCVHAVARVEEVKNAHRLGGPLKSFGLDRMIAAELYLAGPNTIGENLISMTARMQFLDLTNAYFLRTISYDYNNNTHKLSITGRDPGADVFLRTWNKIEDHSLFDDHYFIRMVIARSKTSTARVLGMVDYTLPGGVKVNKEQFQSEGDQEIEKLIQEMRDLQPVDSFIMFN